MFDNININVREKIKEYLNDRIYMLCLLLTAAGSYGFLISHYSVSIDDLGADYYYNQGGLIAQGRLTATILMKLLKLTENCVWIQDFLGITALCLSVILFSIIFDCFTDTKNHLPQLFFSCLFVSYPLHSELFSYSGCSMAIGGGCILTALSVLCILKAAAEKKRRCYLYAALLIAAAASWYESLIVIYIQTVLFVFVLYQSDKKLKLNRLIGNAMHFVVPLAAGMLFESAAAAAVRVVLRIPKTKYATGSGFKSVTSFHELAAKLKIVFLYNFPKEVMKSLFYFPLFLFFLSVFALCIITLLSLIKKKGISSFLTYLFLIITPFILPVVITVFQYRMCQAFGINVALVAFLIIKNCCDKDVRGSGLLKKAVCLVFAFVVLLQTSLINDYFVLDNKRYEREKQLMTGIGTYMYKYDLCDKKLYLTGDYDDALYTDVCPELLVKKDDRRIALLRKLMGRELFGVFFEPAASEDYYYKIQQTNCNSYIKWSYVADFDFQEWFFRYLGYDRISCVYESGLKATEEDRDCITLAEEYRKDMGIWPEESSVKITDKYVIVKIAETEE